MSEIYCAAAFGGCHVIRPLMVMEERGIARSVFRSVGFPVTPFCYTPNVALQLVAVSRGEIELPSFMRPLVLMNPRVDIRPDPNCFADLSVTIVEPNTPVDIWFRGFALNSLLVQTEVVNKIRERDPVLGRIAVRWRGEGLLKANEEIRAATAAELIKALRPETADEQFILDMVVEARGERLDERGIVSALKKVRDTLPGAIGVALHTFQYMPDGRDVYWPPDFKQHVTNAARGLGLPVFEPSEIIRRHGTAVALEADYRHYKPTFYPIMATALFEFIEGFASRDSSAVPRMRAAAQPALGYAEAAT